MIGPFHCLIKVFASYQLPLSSRDFLSKSLDYVKNDPKHPNQSTKQPGSLGESNNHVGPKKILIAVKNLLGMLGPDCQRS